jgi:magnesium chelatase family protein
MRRCRCTPEAARQYRKRISGPILDRIELCALLSRPRHGDRGGPEASEVRESVARVWDVQRRRGERLPSLGQPEEAWLHAPERAQTLSFRGLHSALRVARTIADIEKRDAIALEHLQEAWSFRCAYDF